MKKIFSILLFLTISATSYSQIEDPVKWTTKVIKTSDTEATLITKATIEKGWHLYSQSVPENGPLPTVFAYKSSENYNLIGSTEEEKGHTVNDPVFEMVIKFFENKATFEQKINISEELKTITATVEFMVCDDEKCLPPTEVDLIFNLSESGIENQETIKKIEDSNKVDNSSANSLLYGMGNNSLQKTDKNCSDNSSVATEIKEDRKSLWNIFALGFLGGLLALLTPCVFPMIPLTVSFFTKSSQGKKNRSF